MGSSTASSPLHHPLSAPVLLLAVILTVYYPALLSGILPIDDPGIIAKFSVSPPLSSILLPGNSYYYRPLIEFSYYLDNLMWDMAQSAMHLENILLHCANSLLVYLLARRISCDDKSRLIPLLAALLFALHPVNVEAVAWIAGRTDPLLSMFVLSATNLWLRWLEKPKWQDLIAVLLLFVAAVLTKETALAFCAVALLLALTWPGEASSLQRFKGVGIIIAPGLLLLMLALFFRNDTSGFERFISGGDLHLAQGTWKALTASGFYVKKLFLPFPLNFAINSVHPVYGLFGLLLLPVLWLLIRRDRLSGVLFISAAIFFLPAVLVAMKQIAWTPFAERYLYLSTAYFSLGLVRLHAVWHLKWRDALLTFSTILLCGSAVACFYRVLIWKDPLSLIQDAVKKSPEFGSVYHSLGGLLIQKGQTDLAAEAFATADRLNQRDSIRYPIKASIMGTMLARGNYNEARTYFFQLFKNKQDAPVDFLELLYLGDAKRLESIANVEKVLLAHDLLETLGLLNLKKPDPFWLYRSGQIALVAGNNNEAADFFRRAYSAAPMDAHYKAAAKTYLLRLETGK